MRGVALAVVAGVALVGCETGSFDSGPYIYPVRLFGEPPMRSFSVRFSDWRHDDGAVAALIAGECGPDFQVARVIDRPYDGTLLHPQALRVSCGPTPFAQTPLDPRQTIDPGYLIVLPTVVPADPGA